jgi:O-acetyl-ADP-ribose deacetylase (regulator of RNase III)
MIRYTQGNLLESGAEALVNTVNEVGVMGKGIALMFRDAFPDNMSAYAAACRKNEVRVGKMFVTENHELTGPRWIVNFPTKKHWRHGTRLEWVQAGLQDLVRVIQEKNIRSIALPPLGCGNGGLKWSIVRPEIEAALSLLEDVDVLVFAPTEHYQNKPKDSGVEVLTVARALILELIRRYSVMGVAPSNLEVQKLAWFLKRSIEAVGLRPIKNLTFKPDRYGPFAENLRHQLNALDGSYLHSDKRLSDARPLDPIYFDDSKADVVREFLSGDEALPYIPALDRASEMIDGFESPLGMELLSTVDWLLMNGCEATVGALRSGLAKWPGGQNAGERKLRVFDERLLSLAIDRLVAFGGATHPAR